MNCCSVSCYQLTDHQQFVERIAMDGRFERPTASLGALGARYGVNLGAWNKSGQLDLRVDGGSRVTVRRGVGSALVLEAGVCRLPERMDEREAFVDRVMLRVTANAAKRSTALTLDADGERLTLQVALDGEDVPRFEEGLEAFLNDLDYWIGVVGLKR